MKLSNFAGMEDTITIIPARQAAPFAGSFDFSSPAALDTLSPPEIQYVKEVGTFLQTGARMEPPTPGVQGAIGGDWVFWMILAGMLFLAIAKFNYEKRFNLLLSSIFSRSSAHQLMREFNLFGSQSFIYFTVVFLFSSLVLLHQVFQVFGETGSSPWPDMLIYLEILGAYLAFVLIKFLVILSGGFLFRNPDTAREYIQNIIIFNLTGGVILLPLMLLTQYGPREILLFVTFGLIGIIVIIRFLRGFFIGLSDQKFSLFHLFLYLCTLEILPVLILAKFVDKYFFL